MAHLTDDDIQNLAKLSKLDLTPDQLSKFKREIEEIMNYVEILQSVDVSGLKPTNQVTGLTNVTRPDEVEEYTDPQQLLKNIRQREGDYIKVNQMIG